MRLKERLASFALALIGVNLTTYIVIRINYSNGVYPPEADSIIIPIFTAGAGSIITALYLLALIFIPKLLIENIRNRIPKGVGISLAVLAHLPVFLIGIITALYWWGPAHYVISFSYVGGMAVLAYWIKTDIKQLLSNHSLGRPAAR